MSYLSTLCMVLGSHSGRSQLTTRQTGRACTGVTLHWSADLQCPLSSQVGVVVGQDLVPASPFPPTCSWLLEWRKEVARSEGPIQTEPTVCQLPGCPPALALPHSTTSIRRPAKKLCPHQSWRPWPAAATSLKPLAKCMTLASSLWTTYPWCSKRRVCIPEAE